MTPGVALKQRSLTLPKVAKPMTTAPASESVPGLLYCVYPDSGVGASDSDDDELRLLQSRSPSTPEPTVGSEAVHSVGEESDVCRVPRSTPHHRYRQWRNPRTKQTIATNAPITIADGTLPGCGKRRKIVGKRKKKNSKRYVAGKDGGVLSSAGRRGGAYARTWPGAPMWTNLQYFADTPAVVTDSPGRSVGRQTALSQAVQTDFALIDGKSMGRVFADRSSTIAPEVAANILRTLSAERFSWGTLMRVLQADLQPKDGFGVYTWGVRHRDSHASKLPLPPSSSFQPPSILDTFHCGPPKPFLKVEGSRYTAAGLVRSKQNAVYQTNGCDLPATWILPKHDSRTPGELAIIMGRERNKKKATPISHVGNATAECGDGFSRTLEEGEAKQRNMHVMTRTFRLPTIKGADEEKKSAPALQLKSNRLPVSVAKQWPRHRRYGGSMRGPVDPRIDVSFEFSVVKLPRLDRHVNLLSVGMGSMTSTRRCCPASVTRIPDAPPATPATSFCSPTPSFDAVRPRSEALSSSQSSSGTDSRHSPPDGSIVNISERLLHIKVKQEDNVVNGQDSRHLRENDDTTELEYSKPEYVRTEEDSSPKPTRRRGRHLHALSTDIVALHSHETVLNMPSIQREPMNNKFRGGSVIKTQGSKMKAVEKVKDLIPR